MIEFKTIDCDGKITEMCLTLEELIHAFWDNDSKIQIPYDNEELISARIEDTNVDFDTFGDLLDVLGIR